MLAEILDTDMSHWPPVTKHVRLSPPYRGYDYVAVSCLNMPGANRSEVLPASETGAYVDMMGLWVGRLMTVDSVLENIGYEVTG